MAGPIVVGGEYQGIDGIAHGGYLAGLLAGRLDGPAEVTLRRPPPLNTALQVEASEGMLSLRDESGAAVMEARRTAPNLELSEVDPEAIRRRPPHPRHHQHPYPHCFVCGSERADGFGLRFSAPDADGLTTGLWTPSGPLLPETAVVPDEFVWAVIDCLTAWSFADHWHDPEWWPALIGRISVAVSGPVVRGRDHVVVGRLAGKQGRRILVEAALADGPGSVLAHAAATWVTVVHAPTGPVEVG